VLGRRARATYINACSFGGIELVTSNPPLDVFVHGAEELFPIPLGDGVKDGMEIWDGECE
jgi:hypothetical protein